MAQTILYWFEQTKIGPLPTSNELSDMWDDYHVFLIATVVFTRLKLDEVYHLIELPFDWLIEDVIFACLLDARLLLQQFDTETGGFELASTNTLALKSNRLTECVTHPTLLLWLSRIFKKLTL